MMQEARPRSKVFLRGTTLSDQATGLLLRLLAAFVLPWGRLAATPAAGVIRTQARPRAAVIRFLAPLRWSAHGSVLEHWAQRVTRNFQTRVGLGFCDLRRPAP